MVVVPDCTSINSNGVKSIYQT